MEIRHDTHWIEVPQEFDEERVAEIGAALRESGIPFTTDAFAKQHGKMYDGLTYKLFVDRDYGKSAAKLLCDALDLEDPDQVQPFTGDCPSCGAAVKNSWTCPACELGFHSRFERDDPMIAFVRQYGGFG